MNELSTQNLGALPHPDVLKNTAKSIAALEAILSPEWGDRYYSYNNWGENEEVFEMRDGGGDQMLILFCAQGVVISGFAHESIMKNEKGLKENIPDEFKEFMYEEPVKSIGTTFCIWKTNADKAWQIGAINFPEDAYLDGSRELLKILDGHPETYQNWALEYYELDEFAIEWVQKVYQHEVMTLELVHKINPDLDDFEQLKSDLSEIGYEYKF